MSKYREFFHTLNLSSLDFPVSLRSIELFSFHNRLSIRVWEIELPLVSSEGSYPVSLKCILETNNSTPFINLLLYCGHFIAIKNLNALVRFTINVSETIIVCDHCATCYFSSISAYSKHLDVCMSYNKEDFDFKMPDYGKVFFKNFNKQFKVRSIK